MITLQEATVINPRAIMLHSGVLFDVFDPNPDDINVEDIAHALSNLCRFGGHSPQFYSVAQHCVLCSHIDGSPREQLEFLMHDSSEAYLADLPRPIKRQLSEYSRVEDNLLEIIFKKFDLSFPLSEKVKQIDNCALAFEYKSFFEMRDYSFDYWKPEEAKEKFLARFEELKNKIADEAKI